MRAGGRVGDVDESPFRFGDAVPAVYESSPGCRRGFCPRCGTPISFGADYIPGLIDIAIGSLDEPGRLAPTSHYRDSMRLSWLHIDDGLPRHPEFPSTE